LGACGSRVCWERSDVTWEVATLSLVARLRNTKPKDKGYHAGGQARGAPIQQRTVSPGIHARGSTPCAGEIPVQVVLEEERIRPGTVR
jgi:hypothetical protein